MCGAGAGPAAGAAIGATLVRATACGSVCVWFRLRAGPNAEPPTQKVYCECVLGAVPYQMAPSPQSNFWRGTYFWRHTCIALHTCYLVAMQRDAHEHTSEHAARKREQMEPQRRVDIIKTMDEMERHLRSRSNDELEQMWYLAADSERESAERDGDMNAALLSGMFMRAIEHVIDDRDHA